MLIIGAGIAVLQKRIDANPTEITETHAQHRAGGVGRGTGHMTGINGHVAPK